MNQLHHERIDKGMARGPRNKHKPPAKRSETGHPSIPAGLQADQVLERYLTETTTSQIAQEYGVSRKCLIRWLRDVAPDKWKQVQIVRALCRKDDGDEGIEVACDALSLARAREQLKSGQWDLERLDSANYGVKQEVTHVNTPPIAVILERPVSDLLSMVRGRIIPPQDHIPVTDQSQVIDNTVVIADK